MYVSVQCERLKLVRAMHAVGAVHAVCAVCFAVHVLCVLCAVIKVENGNDLLPCHVTSVLLRN